MKTQDFLIIGCTCVVLATQLFPLCFLGIAIIALVGYIKMAINDNLIDIIEQGEDISNKTSWSSKMDAKVKERENKKL